MRASDLLSLSNSKLRAMLLAGHPFDPQALAGSRYRGISLGLPAWVEALTWKKFAKCFSAVEDGTIRGWNQRIVQDGLDAEWTPQRDKDDAPRCFGFFTVLPRDQLGVPRGLEHSCLIHYGLGGNHPLDPTGRLRDPLVSLNEGDSDLLLGWSYLDLGAGMRLGTPSYFVLERDGPIACLAQPPHPAKATN